MSIEKKQRRTAITLKQHQAGAQTNNDMHLSTRKLPLSNARKALNSGALKSEVQHLCDQTQ
jgi:hypothetical protein